MTDARAWATDRSLKEIKEEFVINQQLKQVNEIGGIWNLAQKE